MLISAIGLLTAVFVIVQALVISQAISPIITGTARPKEVWTWVGIFAVLAIARALLTAAREALGHRAAENAIRELRALVIDSATALGPRWRAAHGTPTAALLTRGLDSLAPYFVKFLPQLILTMTATPLALLTILFLDFWSAFIAAIVVPLIPIFMILIGRFTQESTSIKLKAMERLSAQLLDLMTGLPTLRALGREDAPKEHLKELSTANTNATMATLRIAFLSGGALEFLATLSVALVAVEVGFRLVTANIPLSVGLAVIMLAPEVFEPLRQVGAQFHASADGVAAANAAFDIIEEAQKVESDNEVDLSIPSLAEATILINDVSVAARGAWAPHNLNAVIRPGRITVLTGNSGVGKTTTALAILGLEQPTTGSITLSTAEAVYELSDALTHASAREQWWLHVTWVPQSPTFIAGTLTQILPEGTTADERRMAAELTGFDAVLEDLPHGWDTVIGSRGVGLSVGQRQRLALMNAFLDNSSLIVLDEPTAHLDAMSEETVIRSVQALKDHGKTVIVIAHRSAIHAIADDTITVDSGIATPEEIEQYPILTPVDTLSDLTVTLPSFLDDALIEGGSE